LEDDGGNMETTNKDWLPAAAALPGDHEVRFGDFQLYPARRLLLRNGEPIKIGSRALALLAALAERPGQIVTNEALMTAGWPDTHVEEANLRVQMGTLRRLLDDGITDLSYIFNAPGRGYSLSFLAVETAGSKATTSGREPLGLSSPLTHLVGRQEAVLAVLTRIKQRRLVTIVGPGGIGKTRVAIEVAWARTSDSSQRVCFVDLASLSAGEFVATTIATALQFEGAKDLSTKEVLSRGLRAEPTLLVLDNCEHVLETVAELANTLLREVPTLRVLATSREPLLIDGEVTVRLGGLALPDEATETPTLSDVLSYPAVELFVDRATASSDSVVFLDEDADLLVRICRKLDGIPLAIELAAARMEVIGLARLSQVLGDQFSVFGGGRRSALPRNRTLGATLHWSFDLLAEEEKDALVCLSVFRTTFSMDAAIAVLPFPAQTVMRRLSDLVAKSLVVVERRGQTVSYRLLETTRAFAEGKLAAWSTSYVKVARSHAEYFLQMFIQGNPNERRAEDYRQIVPDVRAAIRWALSHAEHVNLGIRLIIDSAPMWLRLSILKEYASIIEAAADRLWLDPAIVSRDAMWLAPSLHNAHYNSIGLSDKIFPMLENALRLAGEYGDSACMLNCLWPMFGTRLTQARYDEALGYSYEFARIADHVADPVQKAMGHRIVALSLWRDGEFETAFDHATSALKSTEEKVASPFGLTFMYKQGVASRANMSNLLWLRGQPDQAVALAQEAVSIGLHSDVVGLCYALSQTIIPLSFWTGDIGRARTQTALLLKLTKESGLEYWHLWGRCHDSAITRIKTSAQGDTDAIEANMSRIEGLHRHVLATILPDLPISWVTELDGQWNRSKAHWCTAELQRVAALQLLSSGDKEGARAQLEFAIDTARGQGAVAWELRAATTLAELDMDEGMHQRARQRLLPLLDQVVDGIKTRDVRAAVAILNATG